MKSTLFQKHIIDIYLRITYEDKVKMYLNTIIHNFTDMSAKIKGISVSYVYR